MDFDAAFSVRRALRRAWSMARLRPLLVALWLGATSMWIAECHPAPSTALPPDESSRTTAYRDGDRIVVVDLDAPGGPRAHEDPSALLTRDQQTAQFLLAVVMFFAAGFVMLTLEAWLHPGWLRLQANVLQGDKPSLRVLFSGRDRFLRMWGWKLLSRLVGYLVFFGAAMPALLVEALGAPTWASAGVFAVGEATALAYVVTGLLFGGYAVTFDGARPRQALRQTWAMARGHRLRLLLFVAALLLVQLAAAVAGVLALCIGLLVTLPLGRAVADLALTDAYLVYARSGRAPG